MADVDFEGVGLNEGNLFDVLRDAAHGSVPVRDVEAAQNWGMWARALAVNLAEGPLRDALGRAIVKLAGSDDAAERALANSLNSTVAVVDGGELLRLFFDQVAQARWSAASDVASALITVNGRGALPYDQRLFDLLLRTDLPRDLFDNLLMLADGHACPWLLQHPEIFFGSDEDDTLLRLSDATMRLDSATLEQFVRDLGAEMGRRGHPLSPSSLQSVQHWITSRKKAEAAART